MRAGFSGSPARGDQQAGRRLWAAGRRSALPTFLHLPMPDSDYNHS
jgi:hypothetical protein